MDDDDGSKHQSLPIFTGFDVTSAQYPTRVQDVERGKDGDEYLLEGMVGVTSAPDCADIIAYLALANASNTAVMVHTFYDGPDLLAGMGVPLSVDPGVLVYGDDIIPKNGATAVPQRGGLGLEPGADVIRAYRLA